MSEQQAYDRLIPLILAQSDKDTKIPNVAVENKVMDAHKFVKLSSENREVLINSGLNPEYIDTLEDRIGAYSIAHGNYMVLKNVVGTVKEKFAQLEKEAQALKRNIIHSFLFALDDNSKALETIKEITEGRSKNDLVYDFVPMKIVSETYTEELTRIGFDFTLIERAEELHLEMQDLLSQIKLSPKDISEVKVIKNKAYTYLDEALTQIKKHGQYVFWEDEERLELYKSDYYKRNYSKKKSDEDATIDDSDSPIIAD